MSYNEDTGGSSVPRTEWATNAPDHWPKILLPRMPPNTNKRVEVENILIFAAALKTAFDASSSGCRLKAFARSRLTYYGVLEIPMEVDDNGTPVAVYLYPVADQAAASHFIGAANLLTARGEHFPVFYAPEELSSSNPGNPLSDLSSFQFEKYEKKLTPGNYSMWWATPEDPKFTTSPTVQYIARAYNAMCGFETYISAAWLRQFGMVGEKVGRVKLPEYLSVPVEGPEEMIMIFSISREKGIAFHFNESTTPIQYRDALWASFAQYTELLRGGAIQKRLPPDPRRDDDGLNWWNGILAISRKLEATEDFINLGKILIE